MTVTIQPNTKYLAAIPSRYDKSIDPYIFEFFDFIGSNYTDKVSFEKEFEFFTYLRNIVNRLAIHHNAMESIRKGKDIPMDNVKNLRIDEMTHLIKIFIPIFKIRLTPSLPTGQLAIYQYFGDGQGTYRFDLDYLERIIYTLQPNTTVNSVKSYIAAINAQTTTVNETQSDHIVPVNNGLYHKKEKKLLKFSPDYITLSKIATNYNANATLETIVNEEDGSSWNLDSWLKDLSGELIHDFDPDTYTLFWQIIAAAINPKQINAKAIFFYSSVGNNGKGTFGQLLKNLVGRTNYSSLTIPAFKHEYMKSQLIGKTLNIADENPVDMYIDDVQDFKAMVTGDDILINRKHKDPIAAQIQAVNIQMLNGLPKTRDKSDSFYRRLIIVPFLYSFTGNGERAYIKKDYINRKSVLEYVLKKALELPTFSEFITPERSISALKEYKEDNNSAVEFWNEFETQFAWDVLPPNFLYDLYLAWFKEEHGNERGSFFSKKMFLHHLENHLQQDDEWSFKATRATAPSTLRIGDMMDADEPLISEYKLDRFYAKNYTGSDPIKQRAFERPTRVRGIFRNN